MADDLLARLEAVARREGANLTIKYKRGLSAEVRLRVPGRKAIGLRAGGPPSELLTQLISALKQERLL